MTTFTPATSEEVLSTVAWAVAEETPLEILGHGSKRGIGRPLQTEHTLDLSKLSGVTLYEPAELVLSAKAGTPIAEIEALLAENGQQFAFEPMDYGPLLGGEPGEGQSAACSRQTFPVHVGSRRERRAIISWASMSSPAEVKPSSPAAAS